MSFIPSLNLRGIGGDAAGTSPPPSNPNASPPFNPSVTSPSQDSFASTNGLDDLPMETPKYTERGTRHNYDPAEVANFMEFDAAGCDDVVQLRDTIGQAQRLLQDLEGWYESELKRKEDRINQQIDRMLGGGHVWNQRISPVQVSSTVGKPFHISAGAQAGVSASNTPISQGSNSARTPTLTPHIQDTNSARLRRQLALNRTVAAASSASQAAAFRSMHSGTSLSARTPGTPRTASAGPSSARVPSAASRVNYVSASMSARPGQAPNSGRQTPPVTPRGTVLTPTSSRVPRGYSPATRRTPTSATARNPTTPR